ncbi:ankyrin repeat protein, putative [Trichomonas vaginalis G3]|uniref:Ankyrin repeat protein, putative n=1 Tax=Trichomonas vaginalis (strain ATCC PRA-98 / G3) TaxID=412133 RepID=A2GG89_TRIV3|nr:Ankyrin repeat family [Trichomonas vaginalis G3]EAX83830.1 ankyrin repeat protein, putative [Trichomonas vaginalis G3]KAI5537024.1 Ankyrin repeat family [Trichomonas vaginalis G3]|eukprot:XP_001296760.1 ankyrin repeat protein [Trichomonas vaginalis G3]
MTPLVVSILNEMQDVSLILINNGADINAVDNQGFPILYYALYAKMEYVASVLIEKGANVNYNFQDGTSLLELAKRDNSYEIVMLLKLYGVEKESDSDEIENFENIVIDHNNKPSSLHFDCDADTNLG